MNLQLFDEVSNHSKLRDIDYRFTSAIARRLTMWISPFANLKFIIWRQDTDLSRNLSVFWTKAGV
jgi:hypothetical protein